MDTSTTHRMLGVTSGAKYHRQTAHGRPDMHRRALQNRKEKRVENINWRTELHTTDKQASEAFEDRERILDHISDSWWNGVEAALENEWWAYRYAGDPWRHTYRTGELIRFTLTRKVAA